jgi:hypothetical protein
MLEDANLKNSLEQRTNVPMFADQTLLQKVRQVMEGTETSGEFETIRQRFASN